MPYSFHEYEKWQGRHLSAQVLFSTAGLAQSVVLETGTQALLVDAGDGCLRDLLASGIHPVKLSGLLITHGHFDHVGGLFSLLGFLRMVRHLEELPIVYPAGSTETEAIIEAFRACYGDSISFDLAPRPLEHGAEAELGPFRASASEMIHCGSLAEGTILDPIPALGYRITVEDETVAVTGDTGLCDNVRELVDGADLAVIEATFSEEHEVAAEMLKRVHLSEKAARELADTAGDSRLVHRIARRA